MKQENDPKTPNESGLGLTDMRKRFIKRAEFLAKDDTFRDTLKSARTAWNRTYRQFAISQNDQGRTDPPRALTHEWDRKQRDVHLEEGDFLIMGGALGEAFDQWERLVTRIAETYWPQIDFPHPAPPDAHPARDFVTVSLYLAHPYDRVANINDLFPVFEWVPEPMTDQRGWWALERAHIDWDEVGWCLPLYPGVTRKDIEDVAERIARQTRDAYRNRTLAVRVRALKDAKLTHRAIADRLGISQQRVSDILATPPSTSD